MSSQSRPLIGLAGVAGGRGEEDEQVGEGAVEEPSYDWKVASLVIGRQKD